MKRWVIPTLAMAMLAWLVPQDLQAQQSRYKSWRNPDQREAERPDRVRGMVRELRELVDQATRDRAADPQFLRDLRDLADRYGAAGAASAEQRHEGDRREHGGRSSRLYDGFKDGDFTRDPAWRVGRGSFWVDRNGLATRVGGAAQGGQRQSQGGDLASVLLGTVLGGGGSSGGSNDGRAADSAPADIYLPARIDNAFRLEADVGVLALGTLQMVVYQGSSRIVGYHLSYERGLGLQLKRRFSSSSDTLATAKIGNRLADGRLHRVVWLRDREGRMSISVDGERLIEVRDTGFRDPFDGFKLINSEGEYRLRQIAIASYDG